MKKVRVLLLLLLVAAPVLVHAGSTTGTVVSYFTFDYPNAPGLLFVIISSSASGAAACGTTTSGQNRWVTRTDTPAGRSHMLAIMLAKVMGQTISITGKGVFGNGCDVWGDTESIHAVSTVN